MNVRLQPLARVARGVAVVGGLWAALGLSHAAVTSGFPSVPVMAGPSGQVTVNWLGATPGTPVGVSRMVQAIPSAWEVVDDVAAAGKGGPLAVAVKRRAGAAAVGAAIGRAAGMMTGPAGWAAMTAAAIVADRYGMGPGFPGILLDPTQPAETQVVGTWAVNTNFEAKYQRQGSVPATVCDQGIAAWNGTVNNATTYTVTVSELVSFTQTGPTLYTCRQRVKSTTYRNDGSYFSGGTWTERNIGLAYLGGSEQKTCPASIDPTNPAHSVPAGAPPYPDGSCPTARYNWPQVQPEQVGQRVAEPTWNPTANPRPDLAPALKEALDKGAGIDAPVSTSGPATQAGQPKTTTTTGPTGQTTTNVTNNYHYRYEGDTINYYTTTTTTINHPDGTTTTTEEGETPPDQEEPSECELNPNMVQCQEMGEAPSDEVPKDSKAVDFAPEAVNLAEGCPADVPLGAGLTFSYASACSWATTIRPFVLAAASFAAMMMVVVGLRV